ncbi:MAG: sulfatase-like hydrolase/transferase [Lachnospiraceae bacterium]|nr:sulfatase-like hydrolase/transferase [Lachnospiraceae bacterium]
MANGKQVILLMTDGTRYDMLGCYGNRNMKTPNLDRLAKDGVRFNHAYTTQPVCGPARAGIFTGTYPHSCGSFTNSYALGDNVKTLGQRLKDQGIHTAYIGKFHLDGGDYFGLGRCADGWDEGYWYDMRCYLEELTEEERVRSRQENDTDITEDFLFGHRVCTRAVDFLKKHSEEPFFLVVSLDEPHDPSLTPEPYATLYQDYEFAKSPNIYDTLEGKPEYQKVWAGKNRTMDRDAVSLKYLNRYLACNSYADYELGRVLEAAGLYAPEAMIIYTSDHGEMAQSHCLTMKGPAAYDEIARIPLLIKGGKRNVTADAPVSHINLAPTIMEYLGLPIPRRLEGKSILPMLEDPNLDINHEVYLEFTRYEVDHDGFGGFRPMRTVFDGRYKLTVHLLDQIDELYDMLEDPCEMRNLIFEEAYYETARALHEKLLNWMNETRDPFRGYDWELRPWRKQDTREATWSYTGYTRQRENEEYEPRQLDYATGLPMESAVRKK